MVSFAIQQLTYRFKSFIPDQCVDLDSVKVIQLLQSILDLSLVCLHVDNENEGVLLFNLLHGTLGIEWVNDDLVGVEAVFMGNRFAWVFRRSRELESFWSVES